MFFKKPVLFSQIRGLYQGSQFKFYWWAGLSSVRAARPRDPDSIRTPAGWGNFKINYGAASPKHEGISNRVAMVSCGIISPCHHVGKLCFPVCLSYLFLWFIAETLRQSVHTYLTSWSAQKCTVPTVLFGAVCRHLLVFLLLIDVWTLLVEKRMTWAELQFFLIWCLGREWTESFPC